MGNVVVSRLSSDRGCKCPKYGLNVLYILITSS